MIGDFQRVQHRAAWRPSRVAHIAMPILAGAADADCLTTLGDVRHNHDFRAAWHAPSLAEDVELNLAEAPGEGDLLGRGDPLIAKEDDAVLVVGPLDLGEGRIIVDLARLTPRISAPAAAPVGIASIGMVILLA